MKRTQPRPSVVVMIDGSTSAVQAAEWAVDEASGRDLPLRLVYIVEPTSSDACGDNADAEAALRAARAAITRTRQPVKIETEIVRGPVVEALVAESADAELLCVGTAGLGTPAPPGTDAAAAIAASARCPVATIRFSNNVPPSESDDIAVIIDEQSDWGAVLEVALDEARLRNATLLILTLITPRTDQSPAAQTDGHLADVLSQYLDVQTHILVVPCNISSFLAQRDPPVQLIVMGYAGGDAVAHLLYPSDTLPPGGDQCSTLLVCR